MSNRNKGGLIFGGKRRLEKSNVGKNYLKGTHKLYLRRRDGSWLIDRLFAARWKVVAAMTTTPSRQRLRRFERPWESQPTWEHARRAAGKGEGGSRKRVNRGMMVALARVQAQEAS